MCSSRCSCRNSNRNHVACAQLSALALSASVHAARHHVLHDLDEPRGAVAESGCQAGLPPSPSAHLQQVQPHLTLLRRTLPGKQDSTVQSSPFLRPPTLPVSRCHSETSHSPDMRAADRSSPGGTEDGDPSPCPPSSMASSTATPAHAESSEWPARYRKRDVDDQSSPRKDTPCSVSSLDTETHSFGHEVSPQAKDRSTSVSARKITKPLRGKDGTLEDTFQAYCSGKPDMDGKSFVKLCKDCGLLEATQITDADLIFAKVVPRGQRRIGTQQFRDALKLIAEKIGMDEELVCQRVAESDGQVHRSTKPDYVRWHDDKDTSDPGVAHLCTWLEEQCEAVGLGRIFKGVFDHDGASVHGLGVVSDIAAGENIMCINSKCGITEDVLENAESDAELCTETHHLAVWLAEERWRCGGGCSAKAWRWRIAIAAFAATGRSCERDSRWIQRSLFCRPYFPFILFFNAFLSLF
eukprot:TRINITY_DN373_c0_g1_i6.p1 TRINITY_DN373_c0_g1~~TRINITY_DN373_c0_g1_i6.p1  ORF type:complete len:467 (-),score=85.66 TRINITY_DN373_c0_g1_i6:9-1409(-)